MGGLALIAKTQGHQVSGSDTNVYPPMSTLLEAAGISLMEGYASVHLNPAPDRVIVGNALSRGNPAVEYILTNNLAYVSGPQWLAEHILPDRHVLAVAGTHGKTTTASMLAWILEHAGHRPGFLIGGVAQNFGISARVGESALFVVEADEYDTAFFDKRSKFIHYRPKTLILNNLEYDHADIFPDLAAIQRQFHHLVRTIPDNGLIIAPQDDSSIEAVLNLGCWTPVQTFGEAGGQWQWRPLTDDYSRFEISRDGATISTVTWPLLGAHNASNAVAAVAAAQHAGIDAGSACAALGCFKNVKRRLETLGEINGITVYDDFAHHPTAIQATLTALRQRVGQARIIAILEPRSNTMRMGIHQDTLAPALSPANISLLFRPHNLQWPLEAVAEQLGPGHEVFTDIEAIVAHVTAIKHRGDHIVIMSNGDFGNLHHQLIKALQGS